MKTGNRRILALLLAAMLLVLCACGAEINPAPQAQETAEEPAAKTPEKTMEQPPAAPSVVPEQSPEETQAEAEAPIQAQPDAPQEETPDETADGTRSCTISISCAAVLEHLEKLDPEKAELVPEDGWILQPVCVEFTEGQSAFDVLLDTVKANAIHMEYQNAPGYKTAYIEGIGNLYEFDCGELSGWMYRVNGWFPNYGCSHYAVQPGDEIAWVYTCDLGSDVGGAGVQQKEE